MAIVPVDYTWGTVLAGFRLPINWARNGIAPSGNDAHLIADFANFLLAGRKKRLFSKIIRPTACVTSTADITTWRWACHTGPVTLTLHCRWVVIPSSGADSNSITQAYLIGTTNLTGGGTATTFDSVAVDDSKTGTIVPSDVRVIERDITVLPDQDYRFEVHLVNGMRVIGLTVEETPRLELDTATDTAAVESTLLAQALSVLDVTEADFFAALDKIWKRNGKQLFTDSVAGTTPVTRISATKANWIDQAQLAWATNTPGHPVVAQYCGSLDSSSVSTMFYCYASMASGTGKVTFVGQNGSVAVINVTSPTPQFWTKSGDLLSTDASDKIDVCIEGDGANALSLYQAGAFLYGA